MKHNLLFNISLFLGFVTLLIFSGLDVNSTPFKSSGVIYPVKVHVQGVEKGESITYYFDGGLPQTVNNSSFLINSSAGNHSLRISASGSKWGMVNFINQGSPLIKDVYVSVTSENKPCQKN